MHIDEKKEKMMNTIKKNAKRAEQYKRAGYEDKLSYADRTKEEGLKTAYKNTKDLRKNSSNYEIGGGLHNLSYKKGGYHNPAYEAANDQWEKLCKYQAYKKGEETGYNKNPLHTRINNRVHEAGIFADIELI